MKTKKQKVKVYYHTTTENISFLKIHMMLKELGIKNNKFFLKLYDKDLANVDPYDPNLSLKMQAKIMREVRINFWYFIREVIRIKVPGGIKRYELHRGNLALSWCLTKNINTAIILPRQNYKTISACAFYTWVYNFSTNNSQLAMSNKLTEDAQLNIRRLNDMIEELPHYLQLRDPVNDINNIKRIYSSTTRNEVKAISAANDPVKADNLGRGNTMPMQWYDEFAFARYIDIIYAFIKRCSKILLIAGIKEPAAKKPKKKDCLCHNLFYPTYSNFFSTVSRDI